MLADARALSGVHFRAWLMGYGTLLPAAYLLSLDPSDFVERWVRRLTEPPPGSEVAVAVLDEAIVGFVGYGAARDETSGPVSELQAINVDPSSWGMGVGSLLLGHAVNGLVGLGHRQAILWVMDGNDRAQRLYIRHGWNWDGIRRVNNDFGFPVDELRYSSPLKRCS